MPGVTYKSAGVDIAAANQFVDEIKKLAGRTRRPGVMFGLGGFGGCFELPKNFRRPVFVSSTDGVGTKLKVAMLADRHDTVGIDLVAMNVNDILALGAEPLFFLDYISIGKIRKKKMVDIVGGISAGCRQAGCSLIGGETAEMPALYKPDEYDLAGFCVGIAEKDKLITGTRIRNADLLIGLKSNGLHSNGFSMVHKIFSRAEIKKLADELLRPTEIYVKPVLALLKEFDVRGIAHITGGAFYEKLPRIFPKGLVPAVEKSWPVPPVFRLIQKKGNVSEPEMFRTFNMGIGLVLVVRPADAGKIIRRLRQFRIESWMIGEVVRGKEKVLFREAK